MSLQYPLNRFIRTNTESGDTKKRVLECNVVELLMYKTDSTVKRDSCLEI